ncbi:hypothetical protein [Acinetobacter guillouiae]|uniref:hypothetical protein n=1 Tax=Acinetobacter guillouiae TaxID=106649 RepID=UPI0028F03722|nr:hypothetical protein [Acinetobacter guillouiae]
MEIGKVTIKANIIKKLMLANLYLNEKLIQSNNIINHENIMENLLKRISFFLIYLPALIFACQFAYYSGICEPLRVQIATLGLNYSEVSLMGYLKTSILALETFNETAWIVLYIVIFTFIAFGLHMLAVHPSERKNESHRIDALYYQFKFNLPHWKFSIIKFLNSFLGVCLIYFCIFLFTILIILNFYAKGKKELITEYKRIKANTTCEYKEGYVSVNNKIIRTTPILCGNYKCYGIDLDSKQIITYLPENYTRPLYLSDLVEKEAFN